MIQQNMGILYVGKSAMGANNDKTPGFGNIKDKGNRIYLRWIGLFIMFCVTSKQKTQ